MCRKNKDKYFLKNYKTIDDLIFENAKRKVDLVKRRSSVKICILDDQGYNYSELNKVGYEKIEVRENFENIEDYKNCNVVLCDVDGVGETFNPKKQGLSVAEQIMKSYYPNTIVAIFTGKDLSLYDYKEIKNVQVIEKNISSSELVDKIDEICAMFWDPKKSWEVLENYFKEKKLSNKEIAVLEDIFVETYKNESEMILVRRKNEISKWDNTKTIDAIRTGLEILLTIYKIYNEI